MGDEIIDVSKWNGNPNWDKVAPQVGLVICRVQYGSNKIDEKYKEYVAALEARNVPHAAYAYGCYVSVKDAIIEADDFMARTNPHAKFLVLDVEDDTLASCGATNLAAASQAFIDRCKSKGWKVGVYISHHMYPKYGLNNLKADFLWIPRYGGPKPAYPCDIWQCADGETGGWMDGIGKVDRNKLVGDKDLAWFLGQDAKPKYFETGGFNDAEAIAKVSKYMLDRKWWARAEFTGRGDMFFVTGGLSEPAISEFKKFMDDNGWYCQIKE